MTELQNTLYWRRWAAVCHANDWTWIKGRLKAEALRDYSEHHVAVWKIAGELALQKHRAVTAEDLRHACHVYALGRDASHQEMTNAQFSRLLALWGDGRDKWGLLNEPDCLESRMHWDDPKLDQVERTKAFIKNAAPDAYVRTVSEHKFGTRMWEWLDAGQLHQLAMTLSNRKAAWKRPVDSRQGRQGREEENHEAAVAAENCPF